MCPNGFPNCFNMEQTIQVINPFRSIQEFEYSQRMASLWAASTLVPRAYYNNIPDCVIAINIANRLNTDPLMVMQNLYIVNGTPSWSTKFLIGIFNLSGRFDAITFETNANTETDITKVYCIAKSRIKATNTKIESDKITWNMAVNEGWTEKKDRTGKNVSKWLTMPGQMFRYRAAAFLIRMYAPELTLGYYTAEEENDMQKDTIEIEAEEIPNPAASAAPVAPSAPAAPAVPVTPASPASPAASVAPAVPARPASPASPAAPAAPAHQMHPRPIQGAQIQPHQMAHTQQIKANLFSGVKL